MSGPEFRPPLVRFRYDLVAFGEQKTRLLELYRAKFSQLMRSSLSVQLNSLDYDDLPALRALVGKYDKLQDVSSVAYRVMEYGHFKALFDCSPMYNAAPADLKAFLLLALGVRSHHLTEAGLKTHEEATAD
jgi:hypothetical protein